MAIDLGEGGRSSIRLSLVALSLVSCSALFTYGFVSNFGLGLQAIVDPYLASSLIQSLVFFLIFTGLYIRLMAILLPIAYQMGRDRARRNEQLELELEQRTNEDLLRHVERLRDWIGKGHFRFALRSAFTAVSMFYLAFVARFFLDLAGIVVLLVQCLFYTYWIAVVLGAIASPPQSFAALFTSYREAWRRIRSDWRWLIRPSQLPLVILWIGIASFYLGDARYSTLARSTPLCFMVTNQRVEGQLIAQSTNGYLVRTGDGGKEGFLRLVDSGHLTFIERSALAHISPECATEE